MGAHGLQCTARLLMDVIMGSPVHIGATESFEDAKMIPGSIRDANSISRFGNKSNRGTCQRIQHDMAYGPQVRARKLTFLLFFGFSIILQMNISTLS